MKEYVIWGKPPGKSEEDLLYTPARSMTDANRVCKILRDQHGCTALRIQVIDLDKPFNASKAFAKAITQ